MGIPSLTRTRSCLAQSLQTPASAASLTTEVALKSLKRPAEEETEPRKLVLRTTEQLEDDLTCLQTNEELDDDSTLSVDDFEEDSTLPYPDSDEEPESERKTTIRIAEEKNTEHKVGKYDRSQVKRVISKEPVLLELADYAECLLSKYLNAASPLRVWIAENFDATDFSILSSLITFYQYNQLGTLDSFTAIELFKKIPIADRVKLKIYDQLKEADQKIALEKTELIQAVQAAASQKRA